MPQHLTDIEIDEISLVDAPSNKSAHIVFFKRNEVSKMTTKAEVHQLIVERSEHLRKADPNLTQAQAYAKYISSDEEGIKLYKCYKLASGPAFVPQPVDVRKAVAEESPALAQLNKIAAAYHERNPTMTREGCFAAVYGDAHPEIRKLVAQEKRERLTKAAAAMGIAG